MARVIWGIKWLKKIIEKIIVPNNLWMKACKRIFLNMHGQIFVNTVAYMSGQVTKIFLNAHIENKKNLNSWRWEMGKDDEEVFVVVYGKDTDTTEAVAVEEVAAVEEDVVDIRVAPTIPGTVLMSYIFLGISTVSIIVLFR